MKIFSAEDVLDKVKAVLQANLPGVITKINSERTDLELPAIANGDYYYNAREAANSNSFIVLEYGLGSPKGNNGRFSLIMQIDIFLGFLVPNLSDEQGQRMACRYQAALFEALRQGADDISYDLQYDAINQGKVNIGNRDLYGVMWSVTVPVVL